MFPSVKNFLDQRHRRALPRDAAGVANATTKANGDVVLTIRLSEKLKEDETIDTSELEFAPQDLDKIRAQDPFLFYSIQDDMRKRSTSGEGDVSAGDPGADDFDFDTNVGTTVISSKSLGHTSAPTSSRRTSMPNLAANSNRQTRRRKTITTINHTVKRKRRLSTETHPSLMYESFLTECSDVPGIVLSEAEEGDLLSYLRT